MIDMRIGGSRGPSGLREIGGRRGAMGEAEASFVAQKRRLRVSWGDIAKMLDRPERDVRRQFDPDWKDAR